MAEITNLTDAEKAYVASLAAAEFDAIGNDRAEGYGVDLEVLIEKVEAS